MPETCRRPETRTIRGLRVTVQRVDHDWPDTGPFTVFRYEVDPGGACEDRGSIPYNGDSMVFSVDDAFREIGDRIFCDSLPTECGGMDYDASFGL